MVKAKVFYSGRSQAVRIPKKYRFDTKEVSIIPLGNDLLIKRSSTSFSDLYYELEDIPKGDEIGEIEELPQQERDWSCFE